MNHYFSTKHARVTPAPAMGEVEKGPTTIGAPKEGGLRWGELDELGAHVVGKLLPVRIILQ